MRTLGALGEGLPGPLIAAWGLEPSRRTGSWIWSVAEGDTIVGFGVAKASAPRLLVLRGRHRFSRYELRCEITDDATGGAVLHAHTSAEVPGAMGRMYRGMVIGTGGHRLAVRRLLGRVARRARRESARGHT